MLYKCPIQFYLDSWAWSDQALLYLGMYPKVGFSTDPLVTLEKWPTPSAQRFSFQPERGVYESFQVKAGKQQLVVKPGRLAALW